MLHVHLYAPRLPADACDDRTQPDAHGKRRRHPLDDAIVTIDHAAKPPLFDIIGRPAAISQRVSADDARVGGVKSLDPLQREATLAGEPPAAGTRIQKLAKA